MASLRQDFGDDFAGSAFREVSGDPAVVGKWGSIVEMDDGSYDCWIHGERVTERRITEIQKNLPENRGMIRLEGEAYTQGRGKEFVREMAPLIGVRRRKKLSPEAKERASERLKAARARKSSL